MHQWMCATSLSKLNLESRASSSQCEVQLALLKPSLKNFRVV